MGTNRLNQSNLLFLEAQVSCPNYDRAALETGIVHIGVGGFHRSHQAYYLHRLLTQYETYQWGICGVGLRAADKNMNDVLSEQDGLYTLIVQHPDGRMETEVIGSIKEYIYAIERPDEVLSRLTDAKTSIVSLTITEGGYNFNPATGEFDFDNPDIQYDLTHLDQPKTVFGILSLALKQRFENGLSPFTIMSCDNIQHNGDVARKMFLSFMEKYDPQLALKAEESVCFPNSMVDRITPVTSQKDIDFLVEQYQMEDKWPVVCEPYIQWVIEDKFSSGRPALEKVGVQFVEDVTPYEKMKIRLLNAGHSILGIPGAIVGIETINGCMEDPVLAGFMRRFMDKEVTPILGSIPGISLDSYKDSLESRFANPNIKDGVSRICSESSAKLPKFLIPTIKDNLIGGGDIERGTFLLAAWCFYSDRQTNQKGQAIEIIDAQSSALHEAAKQTQTDPLHFLSLSDIFGDLVHSDHFKSSYSRHVHDIYRASDLRTLMVRV